MGFIDDDYLLETEAARTLYGGIADLPIVDPHTHANVGEIVENEGWDDIWEVEAATDHYVWALMRNRGVPEERITGDASNREKWEALASVFPSFAGNPTYEWVHLDLRRRFGIETQISEDTADEIWEETKAQLEGMRPRSLLDEMDVELLCSTDDPASPLEYHDRAADEVEGVSVRPTWRADRALQPASPDWADFRADLEAATGINTGDLAGFREALRASHDYFAKRGCVASDIGIRMPVSRPVDDERARACYETSLEGPGALDEEEATDLQAHLLEYVGELNSEKRWTTQFHVGAVRNYREEVYDRLGPASGADIATQDVDIEESLRHFLNTFDGEFETVIYALDPTHYPMVATLARVFPSVNVGPAWWFNDSPFGIEEQLEYVSTVELLANSPGMVSDSRKLLSYGSRFEMFRRSLANVLGRQVERGQVPMETARKIASEVAYDRPREVYGF